MSEHLRPLEPGIAAGLEPNDRTELARAALGAVQRAPFPPLPVESKDSIDRALRGYLTAFGIPSPPKLEPERPRTDETLAQAISSIATGKPRASLLYVWSPSPDPVKRAKVVEALTHHARRRTELRWIRPRLEDGLDTESTGVATAVGRAVSLRAEVAETVGERTLRHLGVTALRIRPRAAARAAAVSGQTREERRDP